MGGEDLPDDYIDENGAHYNVDKPVQEDKRMYEHHKEHGQDMSLSLIHI